jgi:hypothetical protein
MMNANLAVASSGRSRGHVPARYREHPVRASAEFDLPSDPDGEDFDDDEDEDDDSDRLQIGLDAEWR